MSHVGQQHDLIILGMMRSGTTLLESYFADRLHHMGRDHARFQEAFNPYLQIVVDDGLILNRLDIDNRVAYDHQQRLDLWRQHSNGDRLVKHVIQDDFDDHRVISDLRSERSQWFITRRDPFDMCLSYLLAWRYNLWNVWTDDDLASYKTMVQPTIIALDMVRMFLRVLDKFTALVDWLVSVGARIYMVLYDNLIETADMFGAMIYGDEWISGLNAPTLRFPRKLLGQEQKSSLVTNLDEVTDFLAQHGIHPRGQRS